MIRKGRGRAVRENIHDILCCSLQINTSDTSQVNGEYTIAGSFILTSRDLTLARLLHSRSEKIAEKLNKQGATYRMVSWPNIDYLV